MHAPQTVADIRMQFPQGSRVHQSSRMDERIGTKVVFFKNELRRRSGQVALAMHVCGVINRRGYPVDPRHAPAIGQQRQHDRATDPGTAAGNDREPRGQSLN
jgi:hypothetical protein